MTTDTVIFEVPLNEIMRLCLRVECLLQRFYSHARKTTLNDSHAALVSLTSTIDILNRPEWKSRLTHTLAQQMVFLEKLKNSPQISKTKLDTLLVSLKALLSYLHDTTNTIGNQLKQHPLINQLYSHLYNPTSWAYFSTPAYNLWLHQPSEQRIEVLMKWGKHLKVIYDAVKMILAITRDTGNSKVVKTKGGVYEQTLNPNQPYQLLQIALPTKQSLYPEVSVGKHRLVIHFQSLNFDDAISKKFENTLEFTIKYCRF